MILSKIDNPWDGVWVSGVGTTFPQNSYVLVTRLREFFSHFMFLEMIRKLKKCGCVLLVEDDAAIQRCVSVLRRAPT